MFILNKKSKYSVQSPIKNNWQWAEWRKNSHVVLGREGLVILAGAKINFSKVKIKENEVCLITIGAGLPKISSDGLEIILSFNDIYFPDKETILLKHHIKTFDPNQPWITLNVSLDKIKNKTGNFSIECTPGPLHDPISDHLSVYEFIISPQKTLKLNRAKPFKIDNHKLNKLVDSKEITINEIELTNSCNLSCKNCCTPTTKYHKGFMEDKTFKLALSHTKKGQTVLLHRLGEPLLHPKICDYIKIASKKGIKIRISTNGLLLNKSLLKNLIKSGLKEIYFSFHTKASVLAFKMAAKYFEFHKIKPEICRLEGQMLSHNSQFSKIWLDELKISKKIIEKYVSNIQTHTWAGNVIGTKIKNTKQLIQIKQSNCFFIKNNIVNVRWDGTIVGCCFDSENLNYIGRIEDFNSLKINFKKYNLCSSCDPNWANNFI